MKTIQPTGWYDVIELERAVKAIMTAIVETNNHKYPNDTKNIHVVIDQATGNFAIRSQRGIDVDPIVLYTMFPALADPVKQEPEVAG